MKFFVGSLVGISLPVFFLAGFKITNPWVVALVVLFANVCGFVEGKL